MQRKHYGFFWEKHREARNALEAWYADTCRASWSYNADIKSIYQTASFLTDNRVVFNVGGNRFRVIVKINYDYQIVYIRFVGTHSEYDKIDADKI